MKLQTIIPYTMPTTVLGTINIEGVRILHPILIAMSNFGTVISLFIFLQEKK